METQDKYNMENYKETISHYTEEYSKQKPNRTGRVLSGLVIVGIGIVLLLKRMGMAIPSWVFTWEMLVIALGIYVGAKHSFQRRGWLVIVLIGVLFLIDNVVPGISLRPFIWPIIIISAGLFIILSPGRRCHRNHCKKREKNQHKFATQTSSEDYLDTVCIFGGVKRNIISKDFKGGEITCVFGGAEINLSMADINEKVTLEITQVFGGLKLIVPPHWKVQTDVDNVFGGIDDKRSTLKDASNESNKILVLKGTLVFGGIDIKSF